MSHYVATMLIAQSKPQRAMQQLLDQLVNKI